MKFLKLTALTLLFVLAYLTTLSAMGGKPVDIPMKASKIKFEDGEYIRMGTYVGGEKTQEWYIVARIDSNKNIVYIYWYYLFMNKNQTIPMHYTNFNTFHYTIDLKTGCELSSYYQNPFTNEKGLIQSSFILNKDKNEIQADAKYWDGYEMKTIHSTIPVPKDYPIFDPGAIFYIIRFFDITGPGIVYMCQPQFLKQPIPTTFTFLGKETVKTPAGEFKTFKVSMMVADPFLAKLMQPYTKESFMWLEESPRLLVVKVETPGTKYILEEVSDICKKGME